MKVKIVGTGSAVPEKCVTNDDLSQWMDTSDEWIRSRTGIETRHLAVRETTTEMAVEAAKRALASAHMDAEELDLIIAATITPDRLLPNLACEVQSALGACRAVAFDVSAACSGFLYAMDIARHYLEAGGSRRALVIGAETLSRIMDWSDRSTCVLFGDGAGAAVLEADEAEEQAGILSTVLGTDGAGGMVLRCDNRRNHNPYVKGDTALSYVSMNGQEVYKFAVRTVPKVIAGAVEAAGLSMDEIDFFLLHQANQRILNAAQTRLKQPKEKFPGNIERLGNTSSACIPLLLDEMRRDGRLREGQLVALSAFGAGLTHGAALLRI